MFVLVYGFVNSDMNPGGQGAANYMWRTGKHPGLIYVPGLLRRV